MITLEHIYILSGAFLAFYAVLSARDATNPKRLGNAELGERKIGH